MTVGMIIWLFVLTIYVNVVSAFNIYNGDKSQYTQNAFGKMIESKVFRLFIKFDKKTTQIYLKTCIANILLFCGVLIEITLFVFSLLTTVETIKIILSLGVILSGLLVGAIVTGICRYKHK